MSHNHFALIALNNPFEPDYINKYRDNIVRSMPIIKQRMREKYSDSGIDIDHLFGHNHSFTGWGFGQEWYDAFDDFARYFYDITNIRVLNIYVLERNDDLVCIPYVNGKKFEQSHISFDCSDIQEIYVIPNINVLHIGNNITQYYNGDYHDPEYS